MQIFYYITVARAFSYENNINYFTKMKSFFLSDELLEKKTLWIIPPD